MLQEVTDVTRGYRKLRDFIGAAIFTYLSYVTFRNL